MGPRRKRTKGEPAEARGQSRIDSFFMKQPGPSSPTVSGARKQSPSARTRPASSPPVSGTHAAARRPRGAAARVAGVDLDVDRSPEVIDADRSPEVIDADRSPEVIDVDAPDGSPAGSLDAAPARPARLLTVKKEKLARSKGGRRGWDKGFGRGTTPEDSVLGSAEADPIVAAASGVTPSCPVGRPDVDAEMWRGGNDEEESHRRKIDFDAFGGEQHSPTGSKSTSAASVDWQQRAVDASCSEQDGKGDVAKGFESRGGNGALDVKQPSLEVNEIWDEGGEEDVPMTQEEEEVHDQLRSLNCSQVEAAGTAGEEEKEEDKAEEHLNRRPPNAPVEAVATEAFTNAVDEDGDAVMGNHDAHLPEYCGTPKRCTAPTDENADNNSNADAVSPASCSSLETPSSYVTAKSFTPPEAPPHRDEQVDSDSDEELLSRPVGKGSRRLRSATGALAAPDRYDPAASAGSVSLRGASVFGFETGRRGARSGARDVKRQISNMARSFERFSKAEEANEDLRMEVAEGEPAVAGADEACFAEIAALEGKRNAEARKTFDKYERPRPLFTCQAQMLEADDVLWTRRSAQSGAGSRFNSSTRRGCCHPLHGILVDAKARAPPGCDIGDLVSWNMIGWAVQPAEAAFLDQGGVGGVIIEMLFQAVAYDPTDEEAPLRQGLQINGDRFDMYRALLCAVEHCKVGMHSLPPLAPFLATYGADFGEGLENDVVDEPSSGFDSAAEEEIAYKTRGMHRESLDYDVFARRDVDRSKVSRCATRNIKRAFEVFRVAVANGLNLPHLASAAPSQKLSALSNTPEGDERAVLCLVEICARVLISPFGNDVALEVGKLVSALLERITPSRWPQLRWRAAKTIVGVTDRLSVQNALATYLLPYDTARSRTLQLDYSYLVVCQWCSGPGRDPRPIDISRHRPTDEAMAKDGAAFLDFTFTDVLTLAGSAPEFSKGTDVMWASGLWHVFKQVACDDDVLSRRKSGDVTLILEKLRLMHKFVHKMGGGAEVQALRLALTAIKTYITGYGETDRKTLEEINPAEKGKKKQITMTSLLKASAIP